MLDYISRMSKVPIVSDFRCSIRLFRPVVGGVTHSDNFDVDASLFEDYSADKMIASGVAIENAQTPSDVSLNTLDSVEYQSEKILESENLTVKSSNNETKD